MRDIKFRAFFDGKMYPVNNLDYIQDGSGIIAHIHVKGIDQEIPSGQFELMQYTGLTDRNGQEIYEGDIVRVTYERGDILRTVIIGEVEFGDCCLSYTSEAPQHGSMGFYLKTEIQDEPQIGLFQDHNLIGGVAYNEVIGNIFEGVYK